MNHIMLLGDSIFDNAEYVPGEKPVVEQLQALLPAGWQASCLAMDGDVALDVIEQTKRIENEASFFVISCGGNDALGYSDIFGERVSSIAEALDKLSAPRAEFQANYRKMLRHVLGFEKPVAVCSVYDSVPDLEPFEKTALSLFNEIILREAFAAGLPVIDLRLICTETADFSTLSPIEPSAAGGQKIATRIAAVLKDYESKPAESRIYI